MTFWHNMFWQWTDHCWHEEEVNGSLGDKRHYTRKRRCCHCSQAQVFTWEHTNRPGHGTHADRSKTEPHWINVYPAGFGY
jgi:hypothetical protein